MAIDIKDDFETDEETVQTAPESKDVQPEEEPCGQPEADETDEDESGSAAESQEGINEPDDGSGSGSPQEEPQDEPESQNPSPKEQTAEEGRAEDEKASKSSQASKSEKKSLFGKKKDKRDKRDDKIDELTDLLKRSMAEFDNFRKRTEKEKSSMYDMGVRSTIEKILPIVDNFERGFATVSDEDKQDNAFVNGMDLVYKQILKMFEDLDIKPIETEGQTFDPNLHNAVMHIEDENLGENVIAQEFQKGYTYKGTVIRHSMVQVAN